MKRIHPTVLALLLGLFSLSATAAVLVYRPLDDLVRNADAVVHATVLSSKSFQAEEEGRIYTRHTLLVSEYLKGEGAKEVTVVTLGGELEEIGQIVPGEARFKVGEEVVLCLRKATGTDFVVLNMTQGKFRVEKKADGPTLVQDTKGALFLGRDSKKSVPAPAEMTLDAFRGVVRRVLE